LQFGVCRVLSAERPADKLRAPEAAVSFIGRLD
jgi:hypothetical protein